MTAQYEQSSEWTPCPKGTLSNLAGGLRRQRRQRQIALWGSRAAMVLLAVTATWMLVPSPQLALQPGERNCGGITCSEIHAVASEFIAGQLKPALAEKVGVHLTQCAPCRDFIDKQRLQKGMSQPTVAKAANSHSGAQGLRDWPSVLLLSVLPR